MERQLGIALVELDAINTARGVGLHGEAISPEEWDRTYAEAYRQLDAFLAAGRSVLFDATNFTKAQRDSLRALAVKQGARALVIYLDVSEAEARQRWLQNRATGARYDVRDEDFAQVATLFEPPTQEEQVVRYHPSQPANEWIQRTFLEGNDAVVALSVRYCALTSLPESLGQLTHLQHLDVTGNQLTALPESLGNLLHLKKLYVDENQLMALPESLGNLLHLEEMHADRNQLTALPATLCQLTNLETLRVYGNQLASLPASIGQLTRLKDISAGRNQLISLPESLWQLIHLQSLNVAENQLSSLSESIGNLTGLHTLDLGHNELTALPESLGKLSNLTFFLYILMVRSFSERFWKFSTEAGHTNRTKSPTGIRCAVVRLTKE